MKSNSLIAENKEKEQAPTTDLLDNNDGFDYNSDYQAYREEADLEPLKQSIESDFDRYNFGAEERQLNKESETLKGLAGIMNKREEVENKNNEVGTVSGDIARGFVELPRAVANAPLKAVNEVLDTAESLGDSLNKFADLGEIQLFDKDGNFDLEYLSSQEAKDKGLDNINIPTLDDPTSTTGKIAQSLLQFFVGWKGVGKALEGLGVAQQGGRAISLAKGGAADLAVFDEQDQRISNLIQDSSLSDSPVLGTISKYLAAEEDDGFYEGKIKQLVEGVGLSAVADGVVSGLKLLKKTKRIKDQDGQLYDLPLEEQAGVNIQRKAFDFLGEESEDLVSLVNKSKEYSTASTSDVKFLKAAKESKGVKLDKKPKPASIDDIKINYSKINEPEDIKNLMNEMLNKPELKSFITKSRRGERSNDLTLKAAEDIDGFQSLINRRSGEAFNAEQAVSARIVYNDVTTKLMESAKRAASPEASTVDQFNFRKMIAVHHAVQKEFMGMRAEAGRALQAWKIPVGSAGDRVRDVEQLMIEFGGSDASSTLAKRIAAAGSGLNTSQINEITMKSGLARSGDALSEAWTLGLLTNPTTHIVNTASNLLVAGNLVAERFLASKMPNSPVTAREATQLLVGMLESTKDAFRNAGAAFKTGQGGYGLGKIELPRVRATSAEVLEATGMMKPVAYGVDMYGRMLSVVGKSLLAGDEFSKTILYRGQLKALATREGQQMGLAGRKLAEFVEVKSLAPTPSMRADATSFANYGTFTRELGKSGQALQSLISRVPPLKFLMPFVRTPANIFKFTYERTPLAVLSKNVRDDLRAGGVRQANALARIGLGTTVMQITADASLKGNITGGGPTDRKALAALRRKGWQPYSLRVDGKYYAYSRLEPIATLWGISADLTEILANYESYDLKKQQEVDDLSTAVLVAGANQLIGKTFLSGVADLSKALADPKRYMSTFLNRYSGSFVPAGVAAVNRSISPEMKFIYDKIDAIKSRIPFVSDDVATRRNVYGEPIQYFVPSDDGFLSETGDRVASLFNPIYTSQAKESPIDDFLLKNGMYINMPTKKQRFAGIEVDLTQHGKAYSRLLELRGKEVVPLGFNGTMKEFLDNLVQGNDVRSISFLSEFKDMDDRQLDMNSYVRRYHDEAKKLLLGEFPEIEEIVKTGLEDLQTKGILGDAANTESIDENLFP